jgi:16S rRNA (guanine527-N7)-methyltransferase
VQDSWNALAAAAGLILSGSQHAALDRYLDLLLSANQQINLTRITDPAEARLLHIADALTLLPHIPDTAQRLADVGAGGGVPGIPLAIVRPDLDVTLIESVAKKCAFLRQAAADLSLPNVTVLNARAEEAGHGPLRQTFDVVVTRGVAEMIWLAEWCLPLLRVGGRMLAMKGPRIATELTALGPVLASPRNPGRGSILGRLGGAAPQTISGNLPGASGHVIVVIEKNRASEAEFPRHPTRAKKKPMQAHVGRI